MVAKFKSKLARLHEDDKAPNDINDPDNDNADDDKNWMNHKFVDETVTTAKVRFDVE